MNSFRKTTPNYIAMLQASAIVRIPLHACLIVDCIRCYMIILSVNYICLCTCTYLYYLPCLNVLQMRMCAACIGVVFGFFCVDALGVAVVNCK